MRAKTFVSGPLLHMYETLLQVIRMDQAQTKKLDIYRVTTPDIKILGENLSTDMFNSPFVI